MFVPAVKIVTWHTFKYRAPSEDSILKKDERLFRGGPALFRDDYYSIFMTIFIGDPRT